MLSSSIIFRLDPKELQQTQGLEAAGQIKAPESVVGHELHTVDFDPESQTKHY